MLLGLFMLPPWSHVLNVLAAPVLTDPQWSQPRICLCCVWLSLSSAMHEFLVLCLRTLPSEFIRMSYSGSWSATFISSRSVSCMQFLVLVFLKRNTPPLLLVVLNYMRLFRLLRLMRLLKVCSACALSSATSTPCTPSLSCIIQSSSRNLRVHQAQIAATSSTQASRAHA